MIRDSRGLSIEDDEYRVMKDMCDGSLWDKMETHRTRETMDNGSICDKQTQDDAMWLAGHRYGLHLTLNVDWQVSFSLSVQCA